jgi:glycosyltransferase involved in cell wall biosynthesis
MARFLMIAYTTYNHDGRVKRHAEALAERGDQIDVICLHDHEPPISNGVNVIGMEMPRYRGSSKSAYLGSYLRFFRMAANRALKLSLKHRYDVVIVCTMPDAAVVCAILPRLLGSKVVLDVHDTMPELYRDKFGGARGAAGARLLMIEERMSAWWADRVLAVHDLHRDRLEEAGVPRWKIRVVTNTPDPRIFVPRSKVASGHDFSLVCHGTVTQRMGLDLLINAVDLLRPRIADLHLKIIGGGDYLREIHQLVKRLNLGGQVTFVPTVPVERLPGEILGADVGIVPNRESSATHLMLPVKMLDYATLQIPVIASRLRTVEHYFKNGAVEFFEAGNCGDLADAIERLYRDPGLRARHVAQANLVLETLDWDHQRSQYLDAIDSLITEKAQRGKSLREAV